MAPDRPDEAGHKLRVGLVGLGLMGRGMGLSLLRAGHPLRVLAHRKRGVLAELCAHGAVACTTPAEMAEHVDLVVLCLPSHAATSTVLFGGNGIAAAARPGLTVMECSTLQPRAATEFRRALALKGMGFVDCPVTRGPNEAVAGTLNALMGGDDEAHVARATAVAGAFCERIFRFGGTGSGYAAKLINNFLSFTNLTAIAEAMCTARRSGLDLAMLTEAIGVSGGASRSLAGYTPWLVHRGTPSSILSVATASKDVAYYCDHAERVGTLGPVAQQTRSCWASASSAGLEAEMTTAYFDKVCRDLGAR